LVVIGASTGGPMAVQRVLAGLPESFAPPLLVIVHMPAAFTESFAQRLDGQCRIAVREAVDGEPLCGGRAYIAPGGRQMLLERRAKGVTIRVSDGESGQLYRPCVDISLGSAVRVYGAGVLAVVLTGMGQDGKQGARLLKEAGGTVWSQDQASCVVYGMPQAVEKAGFSDRVLPLNDICTLLGRVV
ncbi:MAG: chemotaxis response regulator protein-glutamate methylesterase, partial [Candidatus Sedimenticola endophacoides]